MSDVVIAGAGPAGSLAALLLARRGARVTIVERERMPRPKLCGDTLNPGAVSLLARHVDLAPLADRARAIRGMRLTGPGGVSVDGRYSGGARGLCVTRDVLDLWLLEHAVASGARLVEAHAVTAPARDDRTGRVSGVGLRSASGRVSAERAHVTIAADGRRSRLAALCELSRTARRPKRWAVGAYFEGVRELDDLGEMHVRVGHYIGVSPTPDGRANACLVEPASSGAGWSNPGRLLEARLAADPALGPRFRGARCVTVAQVLGPMAVDAPMPGCAGLLLAGDAAGFVDPMTGDGMRLALSSAEIVADVTMDILEGRVTPDRAPVVLREAYHHRLGSKRAFNRVLRRVVASPDAVRLAARAARCWPSAFTALINHAGDVPRTGRFAAA